MTNARKHEEMHGQSKYLAYLQVASHAVWLDTYVFYECCW